MKFLLFLTGMLAAGACWGQNDALLRKYRQAHPFQNLLVQKEKNGSGTAKPSAPLMILGHTADILHPVPEENACQLAQDRMPCVRPDLSQFNMPNAGDEIAVNPNLAGAIPNPWPTVPGVSPDKSSKSKISLFKKTR